MTKQRKPQSTYQKLKKKSTAVAPMQFDHDHMLFVCNRMRNVMCTAAKLSVVVQGTADRPDEPDQKNVPYYDIKHEGCKNRRRNGSKWCQACSDEYHNQNK